MGQSVGLVVCHRAVSWGWAGPEAVVCGPVIELPLFIEGRGGLAGHPAVIIEPF